MLSENPIIKDSQLISGSSVDTFDPVTYNMYVQSYFSYITKQNKHNANCI